MIEATAIDENWWFVQGQGRANVDFGAFVNILPERMVIHISQISEERVENVEDYMKVGDVVKVKVLDVDARGRIK